MNNVVLVGRLTSNPEVETKADKKITTVNVAVTRNYKNSDGLYDTDFIKCVLWNGIATNTSEYCKAGDVIGIKGRLESSTYDDENGKRHFVTEVIAERVTFLSSSKPKEDLNEVKDENKTNFKNKAE